MSWSSSPPSQQNRTENYQPGRSSPLRFNSNASTSSSYSMSSNPFPPSRTSTMSSATSSGYSYDGIGHKRGLSETSPTRPAARAEYAAPAQSGATDYKSIRQSLRPLPQAPNVILPPSVSKPRSTYSSSENSFDASDSQHNGSSYLRHDHRRSRKEINATVLDRTGSLTPMSSSSPRISGHTHEPHHDHHRSHLSTPDIADLKKSSTPYLKTLSKFASNEDSEEFATAPTTPAVAGLSGRRQLKRTGSVRPSKGSSATDVSRGSAWAENNWMEKQRQFIQAYEYLCHIGEAKEWIEDIIHKQLPPIVQLEEALRNGITLAEIVQSFYPDRPIRIFRDPRLQFRHSDNIALFFRFLSDMELPELFRFELIDLYEKKNIPKVIYCIHALSWLLHRKGLVDFRIGNLVGQLEFAHHELEETQRGLDKAGVSMPSFAGMGASFGAEPEPPPPEPVETEGERIARELASLQGTIQDLQSQVRGSLMRMRLGDMMQGLWDSENWLIDFQSIVRGRWAREIAEYRSAMRQSTIAVQTVARGFLVRARRHQQEDRWKAYEHHLVFLQSAARANKIRLEKRSTESLTREAESNVQLLQAVIRGTLERQRLDDKYEEIQVTASTLDELQAALRGHLTRKFVRAEQHVLGATRHCVTKLQAMLRGQTQRRDLQHQVSQLHDQTSSCLRLQAMIRGTVQRQEFQDQFNELQGWSFSYLQLQATSRGYSLRSSIQRERSELNAHQGSITALQAASRANSLRQQVQQTRSLLKASEAHFVLLQANIRGLLARSRKLSFQEALQKKSSTVGLLQSAIRGFSFRRRHNHLIADLLTNTPEIIQIQAFAQAMLLRQDIGLALAQLEAEESWIEGLQAVIRAKLVREKFAEKQRFFKLNMEKVVKVQSFVRAKLQGEAYKSLTSGDNPPVGTVKNFVHLLNDSDFDFDEEVEVERVRKTVVQHVRQNEMADQYIAQLDIKIALLVKNKITLDEVVKHQRHFGGAAGSLLTNRELSSKDPFDLKALNKNSRRKLEHYQELFFVLQTQPQYLARLFKRFREQATAERECERIKHLIMGLFGYAQKRREEYYLIKLMVRSLREEIEHSSSLQDYLRGNFFWTRLFAAYAKSPRDRKFMRDLLSPIVKDSVIENPELDLESDPMQIYLSAIENEELQTGQRSQRSPDIPREAAIRDPETKRTFITHLQDLRDIVDQFFLNLEEQLQRMPFGVRYIAQQMYHTLTSRYPHDEPGHILQVVGQWLWKSYLQPALVEPEKYGVVDRGLSQEHKRNLGEVSKVVGQVAASRLFGGENVFLQPLNSYVGESIQRLGDTWSILLDVPDAETQFDIDEFNDLYARTKPTLYIKMADIFSIHHLVAVEAPAICPNRDDILQEVIHELASAKSNESELKSMSNSEICLTLNPKLHETEDPDAEFKALFTETKRCILYIIRVQTGGDLMDVMVKPITPEEEDRWEALIREELSASSRRKGAYAEAPEILDIASMSYPELKRTALENILQLEQLGRLTRHNHYQDLLNAIAVDIRTKHRRRVQRQRELETVRLTLARLNDQAKYLEGQLKTYNDYIEQAMMTLQNKKGKKRFLLPFTKQWDHERELARSGRVPKFGSYKYSAQDLANRGILLTWAGYSERQYQHIDLTISSNEVGVFTLEGSNGPISIPGASAQIPLDDLLQAQFNNTQVLEFFDEDGRGGLRVNVNLFVHLIMRKFYKDKD